jgi:hypothetical protein
MRRLKYMIFAVVAVVLCALSSYASSTSQTWEEKYKEESYVFLHSERTVELKKDFTTTTTTRFVARVQKDGAKDMGEISIEYDKSREVVKDIQAFTITPGGDKLQSREIQDLALKKDYAVYSDERTKLITMPHVVVGSVIDWQVVIETTKPVIEKNFYDTVYLSSFVPMKVGRYTLIAPKDMKLHFKYINTDRKPNITHSNDKVIYTWERSDVEKIEFEEYMPPWEEVYETVAISTLNSWEEMSLWAWNLFKKNLRLSDEIKKKVNEITNSKKLLSDKVQAIIEYIQSDFRYVAMQMDFHSYEPHPSDQVFSNKYGDCKDYTLMGIAMLSEIGVKAYPVLFPSGLAFKKEGLLPMPTYFNHAIIFFEVDGKKYYYDLLHKGYYFYEIPAALSKRTVFVVNEEGGFFSTIPPMNELEAVTVTEEHAVITNDGVAIIEATALLPMELSVSLRERFKNMPNDEQQKFFASFESAFSSGGKVIEREWKNLKTPYAKITVRLKYENSHWIQRVGDMMMFGMPQRPRGTMLTTPKRKYPILFNANNRKEKRVTYLIPDGYEIVNLPKGISLNHAFAKYERTYRVNGNIISGKEVYEHKESRTPASQYEEVKKFYEDVTRMTNDLILIKKKG